MEVSVTRQALGVSSWEIARRELPRSLRPFVRSWVGYSERTSAPSRQRELPGPRVVMIFEFGPPLRVSERDAEECSTRAAGGFVAGLDDRSSLTEHDGEQAGVQVDLTVRGARALFGLPLRELSERVVALPDVLPSTRGLSERLADAASWAERFELVERALLDRLARAAPSSAQVAWAVAQIDASGGRARIDRLAAELGHSRKHLVALFHEHVGLAPKRYATLVRFARLVDRLAREPELPWTDAALALGYADQPHLAREVRRFAGVSPTELRRMLSGRVTFVQDPDEAR